MAEEETMGEPTVFGMTLDKIAKAADALISRKDQNHPTSTGTYQGLIKSVRAGNKALLKQDGYCPGKP